MVSKRDNEEETRPFPRPPPTTTDTHPLTNIIIGKKNRSNLIDITDRLERKKSDRISVSVYLSRNIWGGWKDYCARSGVPHHQVTESALIEYMQNHPLPQVTLSVVHDLKLYAPDVKDRLRNKIIKDKLRVIMTTLKRLESSGTGNQQVFKKQLQKLVLQATNIKRPDPELIDILSEVEMLL